MLIPDTIHIKTGGTDDIVPEFVKASESALELTGTSPFNWGTDANWVGGSKPTATSKVRVKTGQTLVVDVSTAVVGDIEVQSGDMLRNSALRTDTVDASQWGDGLLVFGDATLKGKFTGPTWTAISTGAASGRRRADWQL